VVQVCESLYLRNYASKIVHICIICISEIVVIVVNRIVNYVNVMFEFIWDTGNSLGRRFTYSLLQFF